MDKFFMYFVSYLNDNSRLHIVGFLTAYLETFHWKILLYW